MTLLKSFAVIAGNQIVIQTLCSILTICYKFKEILINCHNLERIMNRIFIYSSLSYLISSFTLRVKKYQLERDSSSHGVCCNDSNLLVTITKPRLTKKIWFRWATSSPHLTPEIHISIFIIIHMILLYIIHFYIH